VAEQRGTAMVRIAGLDAELVRKQRIAAAGIDDEAWSPFRLRAVFTAGDNPGAPLASFIRLEVNGCYASALEAAGTAPGRMTEQQFVELGTPDMHRVGERLVHGVGEVEVAGVLVPGRNEFGAVLSDADSLDFPANAQAVESAVTTPLEQVINGVEGMQYMQSSSTSSGLSTITVTFEIGRNPDLAAVDVQNRVNQALGRMPAEVRTNGIAVTKAASGFLAAVGFFSKDNRYDGLFLSNYVDLYVRDAFKRVPGIGNVIIFGERKFAMRLWLDPAKLAGRKITATDVVNALREQNVQVAAGTIGDEPAAANQMYQLSVRAMGRLSDAHQFEDVVVKAGRDGALIRVKDVGRVELGAETYSANLRFAGLNTAGIGVQLLPSANAIEALQGIVTEMNRLEKNFPPGMEWKLAFDNVSVVVRHGRGCRTNVENTILAHRHDARSAGCLNAADQRPGIAIFGKDFCHWTSPALRCENRRVVFRRT